MVFDFLFRKEKDDRITNLAEIYGDLLSLHVDNTYSAPRWDSLASVELLADGRTSMVGNNYFRGYQFRYVEDDVEDDIFAVLYLISMRMEFVRFKIVNLSQIRILVIALASDSYEDDFYYTEFVANSVMKEFSTRLESCITKELMPMLYKQIYI